MGLLVLKTISLVCYRMPSPVLATQVPHSPSPQPHNERPPPLSHCQTTPTPRRARFLLDPWNSRARGRHRSAPPAPCFARHVTLPPPVHLSLSLSLCGSQPFNPYVTRHTTLLLESILNALIIAQLSRPSPTRPSPTPLISITVTSAFHLLCALHSVAHLDRVAIDANRNAAFYTIT